jgi:hypothetical protein
VNDHDESLLLDEFILGKLDDSAAAQVAAHLDTCAQCRAECDELRAVIDVLPHALSAPPPPRALRDRILAAIDAPRQDRRVLVAARALAAALAVALFGDAFLALRLQARTSVAIAPTPASSAERAGPSPAPLTARVTPVPGPRTHPTPGATPAPRRDLTAEALAKRLARALAAARAEAGAARAEAGTDRARLRELKHALALARAHPRVVTVVVTAPPATPPPLARLTPAPSVSPAASPIDAELVDALRTGKVYAIDGAVGGEAWHLTIVQPRDGSHALVYSGTPDAPNGDTYRTWVVRDGRTVSIGELPPGKPATLEMPMSLEAGDVVAFSREPLGDGAAPTTPFLMQFKIPQ